MTIEYNTTLRNSIIEAIGSYFDGGNLEMWTGTQPTTAGDPPASDDVKIADITLPNPAFDSATSGTIQNASSFSTTADNAGTIGWFRMKSTDSDPAIMDGTVTTTGGGGDIELVTVSYNVGDTVTVDPAEFTQPAS